MISLMAAVICFVSQGVGEGERDASEYLDRWTGAIDSVWSYDIVVHVQVDAYSRKQARLVRTTEATIRQRFLRGQWRVDFLKTRIIAGGEVTEWERGADNIKAFAYDGGSAVRYFHASDLFGQVDPRAEFSKTRLLAPQWFEVFHTDYSGEPWPALLRDRTTTSAMEMPDGLIGAKFGATTEPMTHSRFSDQIRVLLDPKCGYLPASIIFGQNLGNGGEFRTEIINEYSLCQESFWVPKTCIWKDFAPSITSSAVEPAMVTQMQTDLEAARLNVEIDPAVFAMAFPPGSIVYESESQTNFVQREGDEKDYGAAAEFARERLEAATSGAGSAIGRLRWFWLVILNLAVLGFLIWFTLGKRRK